MKTTLRYVALLILCGAFSGCVDVSIGSRRVMPPPAPVVVSPAIQLSPADAATVAEIDAAARLEFESARVQSLNAIAQRTTLGPIAQVHLINATYRVLSFDNNKVAVLRTVIANPSFSDSARQAIVSQLGRLSFDSNRQTLLREIDRRVAPR